MRKSLKSALSVLLVLPWLYGCGGGGGGGGGGSGGTAQQPKTLAGIVVSGYAKNISQAAKPPVDGASVEFKCDIDGDGILSVAETFAATTDATGFFAINVPSATKAGASSITVRKAGYSDFVKTYDSIGQTLTLLASLSEGSFTEIGISGIEATPARSGRVSLKSADTVVLRLYDAKAGARRSARVSLSSPTPDTDPSILTEASFPLTALSVPAGSTKLFANVAYLDTVNDPDTMPGGFRAEGGGGSPIGMLKTFGASQIEVFDQNGAKLLDNPLDRSTNVKIKIAVPSKAYLTLFDEDPATAGTIEVPLYYYDAVAKQWKLHANADGSANWGHLEDNFGNVLSADDLAKVKDINEDINGNQSTSYAPGGVDPSTVTIYTVGTVHHFSVFNSDARYRVNGMSYFVKDKNGREVPVVTRTKKKNGGMSADNDQGRGTKKQVHTYTPQQIQSALEHILRGDPETRAQWLDWLKGKDDPALLQAIVNGLREYAISEREGWAGESNELKNGLRALFNNKWTTETIEGTSGVDDNSLDCAKAPDLCKGLVASASEEIKKSGEAKQAVALLMTIAVDAYNPSNLNLDYAIEKGISMAELAIQAGNNKKLQQVAKYVNEAKAARDLLMGLKKDITDVGGAWPPPVGSSKRSDYLDYVYKLQDAMSGAKSMATVIGDKLPREAVQKTLARKAFSGPATTEAELQGQLNEFLLSYKELGGVLFGSYKFDQFKWGYFEGSNFTETSPPPGANGGEEVSVIEYFNGSDWVPLPGRSDLGVDASHVPVPKAYSFGDGTLENPVALLGTWTLDYLPSVKIRGQVTDQLGGAFKNASSFTVYIQGKGFVCGSDGKFSGEVEVTDDRLRVSFQNFYKEFTASGAELDLGGLKADDMLYFLDPDQSTIETVTLTPFTIDAKADSFSGAAVSYSFKLRDSYYGEPRLTETNTTGVLNVASLPKAGWYYSEVEATATGPNGPMKIRRNFQIQVKNRPPVVNSLTLSDTAPMMGDTITLTASISDPDGADDLYPYRSIVLDCRDTSGNQVWIPLNQKESSGDFAWEIITDSWYLYTVPQDQIPCTVQVTAYDRTWASASKTESFVIKQKEFAPVVARNYLEPSYKLTYFTIHPWYFSFSDNNNDIVEYSVDCGDGSPVIKSATPIYDFAPDSAQDYGCNYKPAASMQTYNFTASAKDSKGNTASVGSTVTIFAPIEAVISSPLLPAPDPQNPYKVDIVELPIPDAEGKRSFSISVGAITTNGTLADGSYQVTYRPGSYWWWSQTLASGKLDTTNGQSVANVVIDKPGHYVVTVNATDSAGLYASGWKEFDVTAPFDFALQVNGQAGLTPWYYNDSLSFSADMLASPLGFIPIYKWEIAPAGTESWTQASVAATLVYSSQNPLTPEGAYRVRLTLVNQADANQPPVMREVEVNAWAKLAPTLSTQYQYVIDQGDGKSAVAVGDRFTMNLDAGSGVNLAQVKWLVTNSDWSATESFNFVESGSGGRTYTFTAPGSYIITASMVDSRGIEALVSSQPILVRSYPPTVSSLNASTAAPIPGAQTTFTSTAFSGSSQTTLALYTWKVEGSYLNGTGQTVPVAETVVKEASSTKPEEFVYSFANPGSYTVSVFVEDSIGQKSTLRSVSVTVDWAAPVIGSLTADKTSGSKPLTVNFTAVATDPNPQGAIARYDWDVGEDGLLEKTGPQATFSRTFNTNGLFKVKLTVANLKGKTASRTIVVNVYDATVAPVFEIREMRVDGLGPVYTPDVNNPYNQEMVGRFVALGNRTPIQVTPSEALELNSPLAGLVGLNGFYMEDWGSIQSELFDLTEGGNYRIGLMPHGSVGFVGIQMPGGYECLTATASGYAYPLQIVDGVADYQVWKNFLTTADTFNLLAVVGNKNQEGNCIYTDYAFIPDQASTGTADLASHATQKFSISHPNSGEAQWSFSSLYIDGPGAPVSMWESWNDLSYYQTMPMNAVGRKLFPYIAGATYDFTFVDLVRQGFSYHFNLDSQALAGAGPDSPYAFSAAGVSVGTLTIQNPAPGWLEYCQSSQTLTACVEAQISDATSSIQVPLVAGASTRTVQFSFMGDYDSMRAVSDNSTSSTTLDLSTLAGGASVSNVTLTPDLVNKTLTVSFDTTGDFCYARINAGLDNGQGWTNSSGFGIFGPATRFPVTVGYVIPEMPDPYGTGTLPARDNLLSASVWVVCGKTPATYRNIVVGALENLGFTRGFGENTGPDFGTNFQIFGSKSVSWNVP